MSVMVPIALFGWLPLVLAIFALIPGRRALIAGLLIGYMFLPMAGYKLPGVPDYSKFSATSLGVLLGMLIFDGARLFQLRPKIWDVPIVAWCLVPMLSAVTAGYGPYEGASLTLMRTLSWGVPYLMGRIYFTDLQAFKELAVGMLIGGLVYVPLCLYEIRMSPQLHSMVYGFHQHDFGMTLRGDSWRPTVFMQHGLAVGMFMCVAGLVGFWIWKQRSVRVVASLPAWAVMIAVAGTAVLCRSSGAILLAMGGVAMLVVSRYIRISAGMLALAVAPPLYVAMRTVGGWDGQLLVTLAEQFISAARAESLAFRLASETLLWHQIQSNLLLGTGRFVFAVRGPDGEMGVTPDGMWLIALACNGIVGLAAFLTVLSMPVILFVRRYPARLWTHPMVAPVAVLATAYGLYGVDFMFNAMENPLLIMLGGALVGLRAPTIVAPGTPAPSAQPRQPQGASWFAAERPAPAPARPAPGEARVP